MIAPSPALSLVSVDRVLDELMWLQETTTGTSALPDLAVASEVTEILSADFSDTEAADRLSGIVQSAGVDPGYGVTRLLALRQVP